MIYCLYCKEDFIPIGLVRANDYVCVVCAQNFGANYCDDCLPFYYDIKQGICHACNLGTEEVIIS